MSSSVNTALMRNDIQEDDWSDMNSLEAAIPASSSSSAYFNPLKALVTSMGIDTASNTDKTMGMEITENSTFSYFSESTFGSGLIKPARYTKLRTKGGTDEGNNRTYGDGEDDENEEQDSKPLLPARIPTKNESATSSVATDSGSIECCFIFVQGLLAGFAIIISFATIALNGATHADFLSLYAKIAGQMRRFLYLLSTVSLVGSLDRLLGMIYFQADGAAEYKLRVTKITISALSSLMYTIVFIVTIILSQTDTLLTLQFGYKSDSESNWYTKALADSEIVNRLESWDIGDKLRLVCSIFGWVCCCMTIYLDFLSRELTELQKEETERVVSMWKWKVDELQGNAHVFEQIAQIPGKDKLNLSTAVSALKKLIAVQQVYRSILLFTACHHFY